MPRWIARVFESTSSFEQRARGLLVVVALLPLACGGTAEPDAPASGGTLRFTVATPDGHATPARVELQDETGTFYLPDASLRVAGACSAPAPAWWTDATPDLAPPTGVIDPYSGATQFYVAASIETSLPAGRYAVAAYKGNEYEAGFAEFEIRDGETASVTIQLARWIDLPGEGWFGGDPHLHIARRSRALDGLITDWMRAEDVHVASLLQSGEHGGRIESAPQLGFGSDAVYQDGDTIVASGQENPRTWLLGHGIVLGAGSYLDSPDDYLAYDVVWRAGRAQGALLGYAHFHADGLLLDAPDGLVDFLEVLQFDVANYRSLYELWDLGFQVSPSAGTDHPCPPAGVPGSQRLYAKVDGMLSYPAWLDAIRAGRTFVTNGPAIDLTADGVGIGGSVRLANPGAIPVRARVRFDPASDDVRSLELVRNGRVVAAGSPTGSGELALDAVIDVGQGDWLAARAYGERIVSASAATRSRDSLAHTGSIRVRVDETPDVPVQARAASVAGRLALRLDELEGRVDASGIEATGALPESWTGVTPQVLRAGQAHLLRRISEARAFYEQIADDGHALRSRSRRP